MMDKQAQIRGIIKGHIDDISKVQGINQQIRLDNPHLAEYLFRTPEQEEAVYWIHFATNSSELRELEEWLFHKVPETNAELSDAKTSVLKWEEHIRENGVYLDFKPEDLPRPYVRETLREFVKRLALRVERCGWGPKRCSRALSSYLKVTREWYGLEEAAFVDLVFPKQRDFRVYPNRERVKVKRNKMVAGAAVSSKISVPETEQFTGNEVWRVSKSDIAKLGEHFSTIYFGGSFAKRLVKRCLQRQGMIIRIIKPQVLPISELSAATIIKSLAQKSVYGRPNARHTAMETLALCYLCLTAARIRFPRIEEMIYSIERDALVLDGEYPELRVPSIFGEQPVRISRNLASLLKLLSDIPSPYPRRTILQKRLSHLREMLRKILADANLASDLGAITFLTFMSSPHPHEENVR